MHFLAMQSLDKSKFHATEFPKVHIVKGIKKRIPQKNTSHNCKKYIYFFKKNLAIKIFASKFEKKKQLLT